MKSREFLLLLPLLLITQTLAHAAERIVGIGIASNDHIYAWFADGKATSGTSKNFEDYRHAYAYSLPPGKKPDDIVAVSIAGSNDHVYAWYRDGYVSSGTSEDLDAYIAPYKYSLPPGKAIDNIVGIGIAKDDDVYTWYNDSTVSIGSTADLDKHSGPQNFSLAPGKTAAGIVGLDIAKSNDHVYAWYKDGTVSSGTSKDLDGYKAPYGYIPSLVIYRWWGPGPIYLSPKPVIFSDAFAFEKVRKSTATRYHIADEETLKVGPQPRFEPADSQPAESPNWSQPRFTPSTGGTIDAMVAVGNQYIIASDTSNLAFYDKQGNLLPDKNGMPGKISTNSFFQGFIAKTNADGSFNENNINLYLGFPKPCDSPDYPQTSSGQRFCIASFYDTRVFFDATSKRFFIISNSRHPLWADEKYKTDPNYGTCGIYTNSSGVNVGTNDYCDLARRYVAFAVSKTEDPRDGFHQYMITENNYRDWPWMTTNGNAFIVAHHGSESTVGPVATVFSVDSVKKGDQHPPYFRYYAKDVDGMGAVMPPVHYKNAAGLNFLLGGSGSTVKIFAFPQANDPWKSPKLLKTSVNLSESMSVFNAVYRANKLYLVGNKLVEESGSAKRYSVRLVRIPVENPSPGSITASTSQANGFLDWFFGLNAPGDPQNSKISYEKPSLAVNKDGHMLFAYGRYPFSPANALNPEARYTVWYVNEAKQRRSHLLQDGTSSNSSSIVSAIDFTTAVVDPSDDKTFWMALTYSSGGYKTVIGKVSP